MAGWQDGAEYAPIGRPDGFATPIADPLPDPEPVVAATPGPGAPPAGFQPGNLSSPPLDQLAAVPTVERNPREPFSTTATLMTGDSAWGAAHRSDLMLAGNSFDPRQPITTSGGAFAPPTGDPLAFPPPSSAPLDLPPPASMHQPGTFPPAAGLPPGGFPPGGYPPGAVAQQPPPARPATTQAQRQMSTTAIMILVLGLFVSSLGPFSILIAAGLSLRIPALKAPAFTLLALGTVFLLRLLFGDIGYDTWGPVYQLVCLGGAIWLGTALGRRQR